MSGSDSSVTEQPPVAKLDFDERGFEGDSCTSCNLEICGYVSSFDLVSELFKNLVRSGCPAAGAQAHTYNSCLPAPHPAPNGTGLSTPGLEKVSKHKRDLLGLQETVGEVVYLNYRGQHAAAQTSHLLDSEQTLGIGIIVFCDAKMAAKGIEDRVSSLYVAGRPDTDPHGVSSRGLHPEV
jgi:hypothetical protein